MLSETLANWGWQQQPPPGSKDSNGASSSYHSRASGHGHAAIINNQLLPLLNKIAKEVRGRRTKDLSDALQEVVTAVQAFAGEEWPPPREDNSGESTSSNTDETPDVATPGPAGKGGDSPAVSSSRPVHPTVARLVETLMMILFHAQRTNNAGQWSLDALTLLISAHYVVGQAGGDGGGEAKEGESKDASAEAPKLPPLPPNDVGIVYRVLTNLLKASETSVESIQTSLVKTVRALITSPHVAIHDDALVVVLRTLFHVYLVSKTTTAVGAANAATGSVKQVAQTALTDLLRTVFARLEAYQAVTRSRQKFGQSIDNKDKTVVVDAAHAAMAAQYHQDGFVLMRALCKLSAKDLPESEELGEDKTIASPAATRFFAIPAPTDPLALNNKILSLELLSLALDYCGPQSDAMHNERLLHLVQHLLCVSLLKNCMSNHMHVAFVSQKIFLQLVYKFKSHLKEEIQVFLSNVFLRVLESPNASFKQKAIVVESLRSLCNDEVLLTQIFLNYDCDLGARNLYKDIVHILTKIGGKATATPLATGSAANKKEAEQDFELSLAGIEVLVTILKAFLRALGLPGGSEDADDSSLSAAQRIRNMLQLDVGMVSTSSTSSMSNNSKPNRVSSKDSTSSQSSGELVPRPEEVEKQKAADAAGKKGTDADVAGRIVDAFEQKRTAEKNFETGSVKFTLSLKSGLMFFIDNGFVKCDAHAIARFFLSNKDRLDKTQMGEVLGREPDAAFVKGDKVEADQGGQGFFVRVLHHYVDALDFTDTQFDEAIRIFLSGFRLPGEAQKIDRIMEKFAEKFTSQNPAVFPSADTAFILAFSVIMLNTDLHNPSIKPERRMTIESFIRNNRGIGADGSDLPSEFLESIFNRIKERPFSLKEDDAAREKAAGAQKQIFDSSVFFEGSSLFGTTEEERKREKFKQERDEMMAATEQLMRRRDDKPKDESNGPKTSSELTDNVAPAEVVKPMFDETWGPIIGTLSQVLECSEDERSIAVCLKGFVYAIRIASNSHMSLTRDTFISSLAKFTYLGSTKEMKLKNVESIRTLLGIAITDGEHLEESWGPVLQCISQLARLRLSAAGLDSDESFLSDSKRQRRPTNNSRNHKHEDPDAFNGRAVLEAVQEDMLDKVFSKSVNLSAKSLVRFIEELIEVSDLEIAGHTKRGITGVEMSQSSTTRRRGGSSHGKEGPSIFSLQKLVEVADYNMSVRPRLVWEKMWEMMADYFARIACHENGNVSVFAIDSLKQLSYKFLDKPELSEFNFQRVFLRPFQLVLENEKSRDDIRELVLRCIDNIVRTKSHNLRSGWKTIFAILTRSANDPSEKVENLGLATLQRLLDEHLSHFCVNDESKTGAIVSSSLERNVRNAHADDFVALCRASLSFIQKDETDSPRPLGLSMRAFCHTAIYADVLAEGRVLAPLSGHQTADPNGGGYTYKKLNEEESLQMVLWRPLIEGLAGGIRSTVKSSVGGVGCFVPRGSILALRAIFLRHGHLFSLAQWEAILTQTLLPAIQEAAVRDRCPIINITSESPSVSNIDFLGESLPLPPSHGDASLVRFESISSSPHRSLGPAELMLEASFTDLRHGGDGNLRMAYILAKRAETAQSRDPVEQPFPDSWIATASGMSLGLMTDVVSEICFSRGTDACRRVWPLIAEQLERWCVSSGAPGSSAFNADWTPCEALVRVTCKEVARLSKRLVLYINETPGDEGKTAWVNAILTLYARILSQCIECESKARSELVTSKQKAYVERKKAKASAVLREPVPVETPYGRGKVIQRRMDLYVEYGGKRTQLVTNIIQLDSGAMLYRYSPGSLKQLAMDEESSAFTEQYGQQELSAQQEEIRKHLDEDSERSQSIPMEVNVPSAYWEQLVPMLKTRVVACHCLQQSLVECLSTLAPHAGHTIVASLLGAIEGSLSAATAARQDEDVSTAFQEALLNDWGDGVAAVEEALDNAARFTHLHGSTMFFMTQEAGATRALIALLVALHAGNGDQSVGSRLTTVMQDVLAKFLDSEEREGHLIDPNVWRNTESGGKVALYCTSFATVVVDILHILRGMTPEQFEMVKQDFFPTLCTLIRVQSEDIRIGVREVMQHQVGRLLGLDRKVPATFTDV